MPIIDLHISYGIGLPDSTYHKVVAMDGTINDISGGDKVPIYLWSKDGEINGIKNINISKESDILPYYKKVNNPLKSDENNKIFISYSTNGGNDPITKLCLSLDDSNIDSKYTKISTPLVTYTADNKSHSIYLCYSRQIIPIKQTIPSLELSQVINSIPALNIPQQRSPISTIPTVDLSEEISEYYVYYYI